MTGPVQSPLYLAWGKVRHARYTVRKHAFEVSSFFIRVNLRRLKDIESNRWFSIGKGGVFSFDPANYGTGEASIAEPCAWLESLLKSNGLELELGDIWLHTFPRMLGYVFNPVSFWFCHGQNGELLAIVCEVNNTFGEKHCYLLSNHGATLLNGQEHHASKEFHVSPFFEVMGQYRFRFHNTDERSVARVDLDGHDGHRLSTSICGTFAVPDTSLWKTTLFKYKWFTLGVMIRIHTQALQLWIKGVPFFSKPEPPTHLTTQSDIQST